MDWSHAGVPGGIPSATWTISATLSPSGGDDTPAIESALLQAPEHSVVYLNPGNYRITRFTRSIAKSGVVLRGAGPDETVLSYVDGGSTSTGLTLGDSSLWPMYPVDRIFPVTSGAVRGSTSLVSPAASVAKAGDLMHISQLNGTISSNTLPDGTITVTGQGSEGGKNPSADRDRDNTRNLMQVVRVTSVSGDSIEFSPELYWTYDPDLSPQVALASMTTRQSGIEDLKIDIDAATTSPPASMVEFYFTDQCWMKNVELAHGKWAAWIHHSLNTEIRDCYVHGTFQDLYTVNNGYFEIRMSSDYLVENNIFNRMYASYLTEGGNCGGVVAYNYFVNARNSDLTFGVPAMDGNHAGHPMFNLYEGNVGSRYQSDFYFGSSSHGTLFRNAFLGTDNGAIQNLETISLDAQQRYYTIVGNVLGTPSVLAGWTPATATSTTWTYDPGDAASYVIPIIYRLGYAHMGNDGYDSQYDPQVKATTLRGGNFDFATNATIWRDEAPAGEDASTYLLPQALPPSLFRSSKPSWFKDIPWPPIGPDVSGGSDGAGHVWAIPAQSYFESANLDAGGVFDGNQYHASE